MSKNITFSDTTRRKLKSGVDKIANAVKATLGPKGRNVVIQTTYGTPHITKDGVTVAKNIELKDPIENLAAQVIKQAAQKTVLQCGDATTTAIVLAQTIYNEGYKLIQAGVASPIDIKRSIEKVLPNVLSYIQDAGIKINDDLNKIKQVASISANNDEEIGDLISEAFSLVGEEGIVHVEESKSTDTYIEQTKGAQFDRGYISPYFINNPSKYNCELINPYIFIYDKKLRTSQDVIPIMQLATKQGRPLLIIAEEVEAQALSLLIVNKVQARLPFVAVKAPAFGERRIKMLEDIAILTKGQLISESSGKTLAQVTLADLGEAEKVIITKTDTTIIKGKGTVKAIQDRIEAIKAESETTESEYEIQKNKERIAMLSGKVAILHIGAPTEIELKEKKDRIDDAIQATQAALKLGIVPGGGITFINASKQLDTSFIGAKILYTALEAPFRVICENADVPADIALSKCSTNIGYNALTNKHEDLVKSGVIDPVLALVYALTNAASVATTLLLTEVTITDEPVEAEQMPNMMEGLDEDMY